MENPSEEQLLGQVKNSDINAFEVLFKKYQPVLFRQVLFQTGDIDLSHDIVQETFIRIWNHRKSLKPHLSFLAYAFKIGRNILIDTIKHQNIRNREDNILALLDLYKNENPEETFQLKMLQEQIIAIINNNLPNRCREIFILSRLENKTNKEIAELFHITTKTVENQITYALKILRNKLKKTLTLW